MKKDHELFISILGALAEQSGKRISPVAIDIYIEELERFGMPIVNATLKRFFAYAKFPTIEDIKKAMGVNEVADLTDDEKARLLVSKIVGAISKFGYTALMSEKRTNELKEYLGDDGWHLVQSAGGWNSLCETETDSLPTVTAQWRELAKSMTHQKHRDTYLALNPEIRNLLLGDGQ
jgi:hypothetical protein